MSKASRVSSLTFRGQSPTQSTPGELQPFWIGCDKSGIFLNQTSINQQWKAWNMPVQPLHTF